MKKIALFLVFIVSSAPALCFVTYNLPPTCGQVSIMASTAIQQTILAFTKQRSGLILKPTWELNTKINEYNAIMAKSFDEQNQITALNNQILVETKRMNFLLEKLAKLKEINARAAILSEKETSSKDK